ncbi:MAG: glycoside hydrolase [Clostridium sp.]|nr:glycoside hydrolase [Clostridium sp.]
MKLKKLKYTAAAALLAATVAMQPISVLAGPASGGSASVDVSQGPGGSGGTAASGSVTVVSGSSSGSGSSQNSSAPAAGGAQTPEQALVVSHGQVSYPGGVSAVTTPLMTGNAEAKALGAIAKGVDLSRWNSVSDWGAVKNAGISFAILATRSRTAEDATFRPFAEGAAGQGIRIGAYIYSTATSVAMAEQEADFVLNLIKDYPISFPVIYDAEDAETLGTLSGTEISRIVNAFLGKIQSAGYYPMLYCNEYWINNKVDLSTLGNYDIWIARYADDYTYKKATMWQKSDTGVVPGISGDVDIDFLYKDYTAVIPANTWRTIGGKDYYYANHVMQKNTWFNDGGSWYFAGADGTPLTGWIKDGSKYYYLEKNGKMATGWHQLGNDWYYLHGSDGSMATGWIGTAGKWFWLDDAGRMQTGWLTQGSARYYLAEDGVMATGFRDVDGKRRYFTESGALASGWQAVSGSMYWFDQEGCPATGWKQMDGKWYCFAEDGSMMTGLQTIGGILYYLAEDGSMAANTVVEADGVIYLADASGALTVYAVPESTESAEGAAGAEIPVPSVPAEGVQAPEAASQVTDAGSMQAGPGSGVVIAPQS